MLIAKLNNYGSSVDQQGLKGLISPWTIMAKSANVKVFFFLTIDETQSDLLDRKKSPVRRRASSAGKTNRRELQTFAKFL